MNLGTVENIEIKEESLDRESLREESSCCDESENLVGIEVIKRESYHLEPSILPLQWVDVECTEENYNPTILRSSLSQRSSMGMADSSDINTARKAKRVRSSNYTNEEKAAIFNIVGRYKHIIECKKTDSVSWRDKEDAWQNITDEFNAISPSLTYRSTESIKKFYENQKKIIRKQAAQERIEKIEKRSRNTDPNSNDALSLANVNSGEGFREQYENGFGNKITATVTSNNSDTNRVNNMHDVPMFDMCMENINGEEIYSTDNCDTTEDTNTRTFEWRNHRPAHSRTRVNRDLKIGKTAKSTLESSNPENSWTNRRRLTAASSGSSHITKQYSELAEIKLKLARAQLNILQSDYATKREREEVEFKLKKRSLELDISIKEAQLRKIMRPGSEPYV